MISFEREKKFLLLLLLHAPVIKSGREGESRMAERKKYKTYHIHLIKSRASSLYTSLISPLNQTFFDKTSDFTAFFLSPFFLFFACCKEFHFDEWVSRHTSHVEYVLWRHMRTEKEGRERDFMKSEKFEFFYMLQSSHVESERENISEEKNLRLWFVIALNQPNKDFANPHPHWICFFLSLDESFESVFSICSRFAGTLSKEWKFETLQIEIFLLLVNVPNPHA